MNDGYATLELNENTSIGFHYNRETFYVEHKNYLKLNELPNLSIADLKEQIKDCPDHAIFKTRQWDTCGECDVPSCLEIVHNRPANEAELKAIEISEARYRREAAEKIEKELLAKKIKESNELKEYERLKAKFGDR